MSLKYEKEILEAFKKLNKSPRGNQLADINTIISSYIDEGYDNVIINASTGSGKSIIGAVVAEVMHQLSPLTFDEDGEEKALASFILMGQNILLDQYEATFKNNKSFVMVKGANNYPCELLSTDVEPKYGDECCRFEILKSKIPELMEMVNEHCDMCPLMENRRLRKFTPHMITNYSFFFIDRLFAHQFDPRTITVWDEAHTVSDLFSEHCAIYVSDKRLELYQEEIGSELLCKDIELFKKLKHIRTGIQKGLIHDGNYLEYADDLMYVYRTAKTTGIELLKDISMTTEFKRYNKIKKITKKYGDLCCKIDDFFTYKYEHIFELIKDKQEMYIKPIFVGNMFDVLINSRYQLFMSATVSDTLLNKTLGLNPQHTKFIRLEPTFPKENKKIIFHGVDKLNYEKMKNPQVIEKLGKICGTITERHIANNESGIILAPSFDISQSIAKHIPKGIKVFEHKRGEKLVDYVDAFKNYKNPSVLISPSLWEGISLDGDISRFQVFVKAPYASLGDKRMSYIANFHKDIYTLGTILKIVQGCGRSVRSEDDYCETYMLDQMLNYLWKNPLNVWQSEFDVSFKMFS